MWGKKSALCQPLLHESSEGGMEPEERWSFKVSQAQHHGVRDLDADWTRSSRLNAELH